MTTATGSEIPQPVPTRARPHWEPLTGIAVAVFFVGSVVASAPPKDTDSDAAWLAAYAGHGKQLQHLATGYLLVFAGLCLMTLLTTLWRTVTATCPARTFSPVPLVAAGASAACIAVGGVLQAGISGAMLVGSAPTPGADLLRFGNDVGFAMVGVGGMIAAAVSVACLSMQAHSSGVFGGRMLLFSVVVAVLLLAAVAFIPIAGLLIWSVVVAIMLLRRASATTRTHSG